MADNDGGPAFPRIDTAVSAPQSGMTLRDWFAGQALIALTQTTDLLLDDMVAHDAYRLADAMLKERDEPRPD